VYVCVCFHLRSVKDRNAKTSTTKKKGQAAGGGGGGGGFEVEKRGTASAGGGGGGGKKFEVEKRGKKYAAPTAEEEDQLMPGMVGS
jgi:hypothetical protein